MDPLKQAAECGAYVQWQHKERAKLLNFAKVTVANLCIRQCFPRQNPKPTGSPKFYLTKVLCYNGIGI